MNGTQFCQNLGLIVPNSAHRHSPECSKRVQQMTVLRVKVKPNARQQQIQTTEDGSLIVHLKSPPVDGKANAELIKLLAEKFDVPKSNIQIKSGLSAKFKLIEINFPDS